LDSGDLGALAREVRAVLDAAGLHDAKIMATSDLNEDKIAELIQAGAPIDSFGVGTELATSADAPSVSAVYKLVQLDSRYVAKYSPDKRTYPASKQVFRYPKYDIVGYSAECAPEDGSATALLQPVIVGGRLAEPLPSAAEIQQYCRQALSEIVPGRHSVDHSRALTDLAERHKRDSHR
jgi:nicotinate phosphoribosyltransferase